MEGKDKRIIVSFDIGIKNLACCVLHVGEKTCSSADVVYWSILSLAAPKEKIPNVQELSLRLFAELDDLVEMLDTAGYTTIHDVLIENQPSKLNGAMKSIQMLIYGYFQLRRHWEGKVQHVHLVSASGKLKDHTHVVDTTQVEKTGYELNKWKAVKLADLYIGQDISLVQRLSSYNKKDDMADSLLQAVAWLRKSKYCIEHVCGNLLCVRNDLKEVSNTI